MFQKIRNTAKTLAAGLTAGLMLVAGSAAAAAPTIDTTDVVATIGAGAAAIGLIGAAWVGVKYLIKVWNRV